jgi:hypothetical protein
MGVRLPNLDEAARNGSAAAVTDLADDLDHLARRHARAVGQPRQIRVLLGRQDQGVKRPVDLIRGRQAGGAGQAAAREHGCAGGKTRQHPAPGGDQG